MAQTKHLPIYTTKGETMSTPWHRSGVKTLVVTLASRLGDSVNSYVNRDYPHDEVADGAVLARARELAVGIRRASCRHSSRFGWTSNRVAGEYMKHLNRSTSRMASGALFALLL